MLEVAELVENHLTQDAERRFGEFVCKNGVVLRLQKIKRVLIRDAASAVPVPRVPTVWMPEKEREEENPNDPAYVAALRTYNSKVGDAGTAIYLMFGTKVHFIPQGIAAPDTNWDDEFSEAAINIPQTPRAKYAAWLKYVVLEDEEELMNLTLDVMAFSGMVSEVDVAKASADFRSAKERILHPDSDTTEDD